MQIVQNPKGQEGVNFSFQNESVQWNPSIMLRPPQDIDLRVLWFIMKSYPYVRSHFKQFTQVGLTQESPIENQRIFQYFVCLITESVEETGVNLGLLNKEDKKILCVLLQNYQANSKILNLARLALLANIDSCRSWIAQHHPFDPSKIQTIPHHKIP